AMLIPAIGMLIGLIAAITFSYRKPRHYNDSNYEVTISKETDIERSSPLKTWSGLGSIAAMLLVQLSTGSMIYGAASGLAILIIARVIPWGKTEQVLTDGMRSMAYIGFVMMSASGFGAVLRDTGHIKMLVNSVQAIGD